MCLQLGKNLRKKKVPAAFSMNNILLATTFPIINDGRNGLNFLLLALCYLPAKHP